MRLRQSEDIVLHWQASLNNLVKCRIATTAYFSSSGTAVCMTQSTPVALPVLNVANCFLISTSEIGFVFTSSTEAVQLSFWKSCTISGSEQ